MRQLRHRCLVEEGNGGLQHPGQVLVRLILGQRGAGEFWVSAVSEVSDGKPRLEEDWHVARLHGGLKRDPPEAFQGRCATLLRSTDAATCSSRGLSDRLAVKGP